MNTNATPINSCHGGLIFTLNRIKKWKKSELFYMVRRAKAFVLPARFGPAILSIALPAIITFGLESEPVAFARQAQISGRFRHLRNLRQSADSSRQSLV